MFGMYRLERFAATEHLTARREGPLHTIARSLVQKFRKVLNDFV